MQFDTDLEQQLDKAIAEYLQRVRSDSVSRSEFLDLHPQLRTRLTQFFADHDRMERAMGAVRGSGLLASECSQQRLAEQPERIGRYRVDKLLGAGGFGRVFLAHDEQLDRPVAVKVPHARLISSAEDVEAYLTEARMVANVDHPAIVPVHDVGSTDDCPGYIVSKYISGADLATRLRQQRPTFSEAGRLVATVAEALHHAHKQGLVHRDVKPGNILIDHEGKPFLVDFGLALREDHIGRGPKYVGTPTYMSPEQARGEGHRVDGRSDIFSLGVVLYELLVGRPPFKGATQSVLLKQLSTLEPPPPRQCNDSIPKELERICLKALSKRATDRYTTAKDLADDLRLFLSDSSGALASTSRANAAHSDTQISAETPPTNSAFHGEPIKIVPKGLRSFDEHDADFFLELLPGPRDRRGLPESIRFWKTRIEERDTDKTFPVGLIYGPSGCGKSSLVRAGVLSRLAEQVISVHVEATPDETEKRLLRGLRKRCPELPENMGLKETLTALRRNQGLLAGRKVVIVLDQFEQWLHARKGQQHSELVDALRQCDGGRVQCIVMVRDDFWMAVTRLMSDLEVDLVQGHNFASVDLFPPQHAVKVLCSFGRAFGVLPERGNDTTPEQRVFIKQAVAGMTEDGKIICVRLALFAEMMKGKSWTPATLNELGGTEGVGVRFLEEAFGSYANPNHRYHQQAARAVLQALLPHSATDIKGHMRSADELLDAAGCRNRRQDFDKLIRILDSELRLVTPTDPDGADPDDESRVQASETQSYYQLTHDYLVPSLREWLTRKQRETRRGRAALRLEELSAAWNAKRETRHLPSFLEWVSISLLTPRFERSRPQREMMWRAAKLHATRWGVALVVVLIAVFGLQHHLANVRHQNLLSSTTKAVDALQNTSGPTVPFALRDLEDLPREMVVAELNRRYAQTEGQRKLSLAYALAENDQTDIDFLTESVLLAPPSECPNIVAALGDSGLAMDALGKAKAEAHQSKDWVAKARLAVVALQFGDTSPAADMLAIEDRSNPVQRIEFIETFTNWHGDLLELAKLTTSSRNDALRSGICLSIGSVVDVSDEVRDHWKAVFADWYVTQPDAVTHSAAGWALRNWGVEIPEIAALNEPDAKRDWRLTPTGLTMLRVPAGEFVRHPGQSIRRSNTSRVQRKHRVTITRDFWLSDREISVGMFQQFIEDSEYDGEKPDDWEGVNKMVSPTSHHPVQQVSWYDAMMFCNWLSRREARTPCYKKAGKREKINVGGLEQEHDEWRLIDQADGYRLPSEAEWEYACRGGVATELCVGNDPKRLVRFGVFAANSHSHSWPIGSKLCNAWGFFDMHGNVWEWCGDWYDTYAEETQVVDPVGAERGSSRVHRGGSWSSSAWHCWSSYRAREPPWSRRNIVGFRVALASSDSRSSRRVGSEDQ